MDYEKLAQALEEVRETLRAMVAGLVADGFTDEQARSIIVSMYAQLAKPDTEESE
jgi:uncharacterized membrane protein YebE (DUF533 family)